MANEKKINAIADAEQAGLYYSSNTEEGFTRKVEGGNQIFLISKGSFNSLKELEIVTLFLPTAFAIASWGRPYFLLRTA